MRRPPADRKRQTAFDEACQDTLAGSLETQIQTAIYWCLHGELGLSEPVSRARAASEVSGRICQQFCDECEEAGVRLAGSLVLDLGAGLGALSEELARRHARAIALEPGTAWGRLAAKRISAVGSGWTVAAIGEHLPFSDRSIDVILSRQVLEHVQDPAGVICEAYRVLKPGGYVFLTYENYLSFWEPHYRVPWLPLLPKPIGTLYLKALGRNPRFLQESVTYTTFPAVRRAFFAAGFRCTRVQKYQDKIRSLEQDGLKGRLLKGLAIFGDTLPLSVLTSSDYLRRAFRTSAYECMQKPL
jgi:ubiquinone/menaquinone biosynthesis C-methylase UbiE